MDDDQVMVGRLRDGDEAAFEALVGRHDRALWRVARTFVHTEAAADDVVQETWLAVIRGLSGFEGRSSLSTWIFRILTNRARTRAVRDARSNRGPVIILPRRERPPAPFASGTHDFQRRWASRQSRVGHAR